MDDSPTIATCFVVGFSGTTEVSGSVGDGVGDYSWRPRPSSGLGFPYPKSFAPSVVALAMMSASLAVLHAVGVLGRHTHPGHAHLGGPTPAHQLRQEERRGEVGAARSYVDMLGAEEAVGTGWLHVCGYGLDLRTRYSAPKNRLSGTTAMSSRGANALSP
jgi:hypothetical protein